MTRKPSIMVRLQAFFEVVLLSGLASSLIAGLAFDLSEPKFTDIPSLTGYLLLESAIILLLLLFLLRAHGERLRDLGWHLNQWGSNLLVGLAIVPILFLVNILAAIAFARFLPQYLMESNPLLELIRTPRDLALFIVSALFAGGIKEELQRAFILTRFRQHLGGATLGLVLWSFVFAAGHYMQGLQGAVVAGILGLGFGVAYLMRGSLVTPIVAHAFYDILVLLGNWLLRGVES